MKFPMFKKETTDRNYHEDPFRAVNFKIDGDGKMRCPNGKRDSICSTVRQYKRKCVWTGREIYQCEDYSGYPYAEKCKKGERKSYRACQSGTNKDASGGKIENLESIQGAA